MPVRLSFILMLVCFGCLFAVGSAGSVAARAQPVLRTPTAPVPILVLPTPTYTPIVSPTTTLTGTLSGTLTVTPASPDSGRRPVRVFEVRKATATFTPTLMHTPVSMPISMQISTPAESPSLVLLPTPTPSPAGSPTPVPVPTQSDPLVVAPPTSSTPNGLIITTPTPALPAQNVFDNGQGPITAFPASPMLSGASSLANSMGDVRYVVAEGDTLWTVSIEMGLDLEETICAVHPDFSIDQPLIVGQVLEAPEPGTICHQVLPGESLSGIAEQYGVGIDELRQNGWNQIDVRMHAGGLRVGSYLRVPVKPSPVDADSFMAFMLEQPVGISPYTAYAVGGPRAGRSHEVVPEHWPFGSGQFTWPVYGWLTQGYRNDHRAVDIAAQPGTFVTAADRGVVVRAGWNNQGYGLFVVIDHNIDYVTLYAHLDQVLVKEGDVVRQGQILGTVGSTGNSTGPHLHFEIRDFGRRTNPLELLVR